MKSKYILFAFAALTYTTSLSAQDGMPDSTFSLDGHKPIYAGTYASGNDVLIQPDGKILVLGRGNGDHLLVRLNVDGSLDVGFGGSGKEIIDFGTGLEEPNALALQSDGMIITGGTYSTGGNPTSNIILSRRAANGGADLSFGTNGKVELDFNGHEDRLIEVIVQPDGKILTLAYVNYIYTMMGLARFKSNGSLDSTFGTNGVFLGNNLTPTPEAMVLQPDGKLLIGGTGPNFWVTRYLPSMVKDSSFGVNGGTAIDVDPNSFIDRVQDLFLQPDGKIVAVGKAQDIQIHSLGIARLFPNGSVDNSFGTAGVVYQPVNEGYDVVVESSGKIVVGGTKPGGYALFRYNVDGSVDSSFGTAGTAVAAHMSGFNEIVLQADGKIVVGGTWNTPGDDTIFVARFLSGTSVGILDFSPTAASAFIYPNPISERATFDYELQDASSISIRLIDVQGKTVANFAASEVQAAGKHELPIVLPEMLPSGWYSLVLSSDVGTVSVKLLKQ